MYFFIILRCFLSTTFNVFLLKKYFLSTIEDSFIFNHLDYILFYFFDFLFFFKQIFLKKEFYVPFMFFFSTSKLYIQKDLQKIHKIAILRFIIISRNHPFYLSNFLIFNYKQIRSTKKKKILCFLRLSLRLTHITTFLLYI